MNGTFQITGWDESPYIENEDGSKKSHAKITQVYSGHITGSSEVQYLMSYQSSSSALFVGFEVFTGEVDGKFGSITLQHNGKFLNGIATSSFTIVSGSGTEGLVDIAGSGSFESGEAGQAKYMFTLA